MSAVGRLRAAVVQLNSQADLERNLARCRELVQRAADGGAELVVLPENFAYLGPERGRVALAERLGDERAPIQAAVIGLAREHGVTIVAGGLPELSDDPIRPYNCCAVFSPDGALLGSYRKIHLFDVNLADGTRLAESRSSSPGTEPVVVPLPGFRLGLSICYDLRFPELYRRLVDGGANVLVAPAAFTLTTGKDHWHLLVRTRAVESQCWMLAPNQWGSHPGDRASYGHSLIVDPWATVVAERPDGEGVVLADLDRESVDQVRERLPSLKHRVL